RVLDVAESLRVTQADVDDRVVAGPDFQVVVRVALKGDTCSAIQVRQQRVLISVPIKVLALEFQQKQVEVLAVEYGRVELTAVEISVAICRLIESQVGGRRSTGG